MGVFLLEDRIKAVPVKTPFVQHALIKCHVTQDGKSVSPSYVIQI